MRDGLSIWIQLLPVAVVTAWIVAERARLRRLRSFGDPDILGMSGGKRARILALALLTGSFVLLAAVLPFAVPKAAPSDGESLVEILLDSGIAEGGDSQAADALELIEEKVRAVVRLSPPSHFALYKSADPLQVVVPPTTDAQGLLILLNRLREEWRGEAPVSFYDSVDALRRLTPSKNWRRRIVGIAAPSRADSAAKSPPPSYDVPEVLILRVTRTAPDESPAPGIETAAKDADVQVAGLREFLRAERTTQRRSRSTLQGFTYSQYLASLGFFALLGEVLVCRYFRAATQGRPYAPRG